MYLTWKGFICGLGIFYLIYAILKNPHCPNCNFPMPRRNMVFAIHLPQQLIKLARMSVLFDPFKHFGSMNTQQTTSFNIMANEVQSSIDLESYWFRK
jgi:hypothetical protein